MAAEGRPIRAMDCFNTTLAHGRACPDTGLQKAAVCFGLVPWGPDARCHMSDALVRFPPKCCMQGGGACSNMFECQRFRPTVMCMLIVAVFVALTACISRCFMLALWRACCGNGEAASPSRSVDDDDDLEFVSGDSREVGRHLSDPLAHRPRRSSRGRKASAPAHLQWEGGADQPLSGPSSRGRGGRSASVPSIELGGDVGARASGRRSTNTLENASARALAEALAEPHSSSGAASGSADGGAGEVSRHLSLNAERPRRAQQEGQQDATDSQGADRRRSTSDVPPRGILKPKSALRAPGGPGRTAGLAVARIASDAHSEAESSAWGSAVGAEASSRSVKGRVTFRGNDSVHSFQANH